MWLLLKGFALRVLVGRTVGGAFLTLLAAILPLGALLKVVGLPLLFVLTLVGAPLFLLLAVIGLPVLLVVGFGAVLLAILGALLTLGILAIKIVVPVVLIVWFVKWISAGGRLREDGTTE